MQPPVVPPRVACAVSQAMVPATTRVPTVHLDGVEQSPPSYPTAVEQSHAHAVPLPVTVPLFRHAWLAELLAPFEVHGTGSLQSLPSP